VLEKDELFQLSYQRCERDITALEFTEQRIKVTLVSGRNTGRTLFHD